MRKWKSAAAAAWGAQKAQLAPAVRAQAEWIVDLGAAGETAGRQNQIDGAPGQAPQQGGRQSNRGDRSTPVSLIFYLYVIAFST